MIRATPSFILYTISLVYGYITLLSGRRFNHGGILAFSLVVILVGSGFGQNEIKSTEVSDADGIPVLFKHLPEWQNVHSAAVLTRDIETIRGHVGPHPVLDAISLGADAEAAIASYPQGRLLLIEYSSPQASSDADARIVRRLVELPDAEPVVYRRIGNYNALVFGSSPDDAEALLGQIKYEKVVQWLGEDPYLLKKLEAYFVSTTRDIFIATVTWIVMGLASSVVLGIICGFLFFRLREHKRAVRTAYSDAGGLTRLNLDGLSE
jgi:hypothetical protein